MDIVERLRNLNDGLLMCGNDYSDVLLGAAKDVESLRQQLAESQAECKRLDAGWCAANLDALVAQTALDAAIRQAKREALLEAAGKFTGALAGYDVADVLRRMAEELKD